MLQAERKRVQLRPFEPDLGNANVGKFINDNWWEVPILALPIYFSFSLLSFLKPDIFSLLLMQTQLFMQ